MTPHRILVIGCGGAGKSTLAREMGRRTNLPVVDLDQLYWRPGWVKTEATEWNRVLEEALSADQWIMDGNYGGTLSLRFQACDAVVFLDLPRWLCFGRVLKRRVAAFWRTRQDAAVGCPDRLTWQFLMWIWDYRRLRRPAILEKLTQLKSSRPIYILQSTAEVQRFLSTLPRAHSSAAA